MRFLHVIDGPDRGASFVLAEMEPQLIGRSTEALPLTDSTISRRHAELTPGSDGWYLRDLQSTNGTLLNGESITERTLLQRGDRITCGSTELLFDRDPNDRAMVEAVEPPDARLEWLAPEQRPVAPETPEHIASEHLAYLVRGTDLAVGEVDLRRYVHSFLGLLLEAFPAWSVVAVINGSDASGTASLMSATSATVQDRPIRLNQEFLKAIRERNAMAGAREASNQDDEPSRLLMGMPLQASQEQRGVVILEFGPGFEETSLTRAQHTLLHALCGQAGMTLDRCMMMEELLSRSRLAAIGETVAAISHGVKNMLQGLRGGTDAVAMAIDRGDLELAGRGWGVLARNLERIQSLTLNMLGFVRNQELELETTAIDQLTREAVDLLRAPTERAGVRIEQVFPEDLPPIPLDPNSILQLLLNLLSNAIDASPSGGVVTISGAFLPDHGRIRVEVTDHGSGIAEGIRERLFEPFMTSKGQRGTGLGLVVSRKIAERHEGTLTCTETGPEGTTMRLELPGDLAAGDPGDTDAPRGMAGDEFDLEFGPPEH